MQVLFIRSTIVLVFLLGSCGDNRNEQLPDEVSNDSEATTVTQQSFFSEARPAMDLPVSDDPSTARPAAARPATALPSSARPAAVMNEVEPASDISQFYDPNQINAVTLDEGAQALPAMSLPTHQALPASVLKKEIADRLVTMDEGAISFLLTDAPIDDANIEAVYVKVIEVTIHGAGNNQDQSADGRQKDEPREDKRGPEAQPPVDGDRNERPTKSLLEQSENDTHWLNLVDPQTDFDLLALRDDATALMGETVLPIGKYNQIRVRIDAENCRVVVAGETYPLIVPSGEQSGIKIVGDLSIEAGKRYIITLDFDAEKSLNRNDDGTYILSPVLKIESFEAIDTTGTITPVGHL